ncbi:MAG: AmmeMemoRadiSam system protein B [Lutimaribacter sp.]
MGYFLLVLGIGLFAGGHWIKRLAPDARAAWGDKGKGILSLIMVLGVVAMVIGYRNAGFVNVWVPPAFMTHIANLLVLIGFWFFALGNINGTMAARVRHKQLTGVKAWAVAHLLVNGDLASIILFGGMHRYMGRLAAMFSHGRWETPLGPVEVDDRLAERYGVVAFVHTWLGYYPFPM